MKFSVGFENIGGSADSAAIRVAAELSVCSSSLSSESCKGSHHQNLSSSSSSYTYLYL